jgi:uncharacterized protein (TIGR02145 family)
MAYPYLPVNPCCTDVVLNSPCGCSSTITNSGCNTNNPCSTNITASSTIVYNGPALTCTTAEPCDTLNVILQKIDEIICNLLFQINTLTAQVNNLNSQIIIINGNITTIFNTLDVCCVVTTTTTTTQFIAPCEGFLLTNTGLDTLAIIITDCVTGLPEAVIIPPGDTPICVETDSPLTVPGTVVVTPTGPCNTTTTTTSSSSSTTTTTTTVAIPCECLTFTNTDSIAHSFSYTNCLEEFNAVNPILANEVIKVCGSAGLANSELVTISIGGNCVDGLCPLVLNDCSILINNIDGNIIGYDVDTNQSVVLTTLAYSNDMANTDSKLWLYNNNTSLISEYDITINPWTIVFNKNINFPAGVSFGAGLGAISNTKLITTNTLLTPQPIIEVTITGTTSSVTSTIADLDPGYQISGDILLTTTGKVICIAHSGSTFKVFQYDELTGDKEVEVNITSFIGSENPLGLAENNNKLYILCSAGSVYEVDLNSPYALTLVNVGDFAASGASQSPECATVNLIPTTTTTTTTICLDCVPTDLTIGTQIWTSCNLDVTTYANGDPIPEVTDPTAWAALTTGAWCWYNNDPTNTCAYKKLYNWYAVNDPRGLAPAGYHIPTDVEWATLVSYLTIDQGCKLKEVGTAHWINPNICATNSTGFTGLPAGYRNGATGAFTNIKYVGEFWTSLNYDANNGWINALQDGYTGVNFGVNPKTTGASVRLVKDELSTTTTTTIPK